jgi:hypothetical protein
VTTLPPPVVKPTSPIGKILKEVGAIAAGVVSATAVIAELAPSLHLSVSDVGIVAGVAAVAAAVVRVVSEFVSPTAKAAKS